MSSHSPIELRPLAVALALGLPLGLSLVACDRHDQQARYAPAAQQDVQPVVVSGLRPGGTPALPEDPRGKIYDGDPVHIANGKRYYSWYNCDGCHFNGGGGIGPAFMDKVWRYGGRIDQIYNSIAEGRPNGMPVWGDKIPDSQIWELAAYVRSLSTPSVKGEEPPSTPPEPTQPPQDPNHQGGATVSEATVGPPPQ